MSPLIYQRTHNLWHGPIVRYGICIQFAEITYPSGQYGFVRFWYYEGQMHMAKMMGV